MKITDVRVIVTCPGRNYVVVKIMTDEPGLYGVGDATLNGRELAVASALTEHIAPLLIGRDPDRIEDTWQYLFRGTYWRGGPVLMTALAGIDMALWDIKGKRANLPLYSLLGGKTREGALCYTHAGGKDAVAVEDSVREKMERGFQGRARAGRGSQSDRNVWRRRRKRSVERDMGQRGRNGDCARRGLAARRTKLGTGTVSQNRAQTVRPFAEHVRR